MIVEFGISMRKTDRQLFWQALVTGVLCKQKKKKREGASMEDKGAEGSSSNNSRFTQFLDLGQVLDLDSNN